MNKTLCTMSVALAIIAYSYGASSANSALMAYLDRARVAVERCNALALERAKAIEAHPNAVSRCVNDAQQQMEPLYDAAAESVRYQRGTSMYLTMYHTQWTQHMQRLSDTESGPPGSMRQTIAHDMEQLRMVEDKLIP